MRAQGLQCNKIRDFALVRLFSEWQMSGLSAPNGTDIDFASFEVRFSSWTCVHSCLTCVRVRKECLVGKTLTSLHLSRLCSTRDNTRSFVNWTSSSVTTVCFGVVKHGELPPTADHTILLPIEHEFTVFVIHDLHRQMQHVGTSHTLSLL